MTTIKPRVITGPITDDPSWLGSGHGADANETITLSAALFTEGTHYPNGFIPSGTPLGKVTETGLYGPYTPADSPAGLGTFAGFLYAPVSIVDGDEMIAGALFVHGTVVEANLPIAIDADAKTDAVGRLRFV